MMSSELIRFVKQLMARVAGLGFIARAGALGGRDQLQGRGDSTDGVPVRRMWPFGIRSVPVAGVEAAYITINGGRTGKIVVAAESSKYGPRDLKEGETALYNKVADLIIKLDASGNIILIPSSSGKIKLGSADGAELDNVVVYNGLRAQYDALVQAFNGHTHAETGGITGTPATGMPPQTASVLSQTAASPVQAKKI